MKRFTMASVLVLMSATASALWAAAPHGQYDILNDGTVKDRKTGLIWQQKAATVQHTWSSAKDYCAQLSLGGVSSGWRLPEVLELASLVDRAAASPSPTIDSTAFPSATAGRFWTATASAGYAGKYWFLDFASGILNSDSDEQPYWVRCVR